MKVSVLALSLTLAACFAPYATKAQDPLPADTEHTVDMSSGMIRVYRVPRPFAEVNIGDANIADVSAVANDRIILTAKKIGNTDIILSDEARQVISRLHVKVVPPAEFGRRTITVRRFQRDGVMMTHTMFCDRVPYAAGEAGPCFYERTDPNLVAPPIVSTGPIITTGGVSSAGGQ